MHRTAVMLTITLVVGISVGLLGHQVLIAQQAPVTRNDTSAKGLRGCCRERNRHVSRRAGPGAALGRHYGSGPEMFYVLEGTLTVEPDGQPPVTLKAGESGYSPAKHIHNGKNPSSAEPTKLLGFWVAEKGQPLATPVK